MHYIGSIEIYINFIYILIIFIILIKFHIILIINKSVFSFLSLIKNAQKYEAFIKLFKKGNTVVFFKFI